MVGPGEPVSVGASEGPAEPDGDGVALVQASGLLSAELVAAPPPMKMQLLFRRSRASRS